MRHKNPIEQVGQSFAEAVEQVAVEVESGLIVIDCDALGHRMMERVEAQQRAMSQTQPKPGRKRRGRRQVRRSE